MRKVVKRMTLPNLTGNLHPLFQKRRTEWVLTRKHSLSQLNVSQMPNKRNLDVILVFPILLRYEPYFSRSQFQQFSILLWLVNENQHVPGTTLQELVFHPVGVELSFASHYGNRTANTTLVYSFCL